MFDLDFLTNKEAYYIKCKTGLKHFKVLQSISIAFYFVYIIFSFTCILFYPGEFWFDSVGYSIMPIINYVIILPLIILPLYASIFKSFAFYPLTFLKRIGLLCFTLLFNGWLYPLLWYRLAIISRLTSVAYLALINISLILLCYIIMMFQDNIMLYLSLTPYEVKMLIQQKKNNLQ